MKFKKLQKLKELKTGDIIRSRFNQEVYVVTANYGDRVTAVSTVEVTNPPEWEVMEIGVE
jgi:hypothetical protein